jgi:glutathione S-transferase
MPTSLPLTLFHAPNTRSSGVRILLDELRATYTLHPLNMKKGEQREAAYLAINPMGKVPAVMHGNALVTEQVAIFLYLADLYPEADLAPRIGDPLRGPYLRWLAFYGSCFEPAIVDRAQKNPPPAASMSVYGDFDTMLKTVTDQLEKGPYMLGAKFTAVDMLWGTSLRWITQFKLIPATPLIQAYIDRVAARPSVARVAALDQALSATMAA